MRDLGHSGQLTGFLIAIGVAAEVLIFILAGRLIAKFGVKWLLIVSIGLTAIRWLILGHAADFLLLLIFAQLIHALSFGLTHAASVAFIHHYFDTSFQSRGQALYISIAFGIGGALGNWLAGQWWQQGSGASLSFTLAAAIAAVGAIVLIPLSKQRLA